LHQQ